MKDEGGEREGEELSELGDEEIADVEIFTAVRAEDLRFEAVPETNVSFEGEPAERSSTKTERDNLPEEVEAGVDYRKIEVRWQARSRIVHPSDPSDSD